MNIPENDERSTCSCTCLCCGPRSSPSDSFRLSLKRKLAQLHQTYAEIADVIGTSDVADDFNAQVEVVDELAMLRETLDSHQISIQELNSHLEEERSAAASAASEAMSMMLRLQREKAEIQMEFRQFKRYAEEKMQHDSEEIAQLEDLLYKKDQDVESLSYELQVYKHKLLSYEFYSENQMQDSNVTPTSKDSAAFAAAAAFDYPVLKCKVSNEYENGNNLPGGCDLEKYALGEMPGSSHDKGVVAFSSPSKKWTEQFRRLSVDSYGLGPCASKVEERDDDLSDRICTVDAVHYGSESFTSTPRDLNVANGNVNNEISRLYKRLQALEADRETMKHTIMSMSTDKTQLVLLKEIAQRLCKEGRPQDEEKKIGKRQLPFFSCFSMLTAVKNRLDIDGSDIENVVAWFKRGVSINRTVERKLIALNRLNDVEIICVIFLTERNIVN